ncbi:MAG: cyclodeaminase/cyclohydrolase family protein [Desulfomonilaceae bacterium]|jgi:formiminotetrahydrofolate cyclodeaminase
MPFEESTFLDALRQPRPYPGGGSVSSYTALVGLTLAEKICHIEALRAEKTGCSRKICDELLQKIKGKINSFKKLIERDISAYDSLADSIRNGERWPKISGVVSEAIACPYKMVVEVADSFELILEVGRNCRRWLVPDLMVVLEILRGSAKSAFHIAMANVEYVEDHEARRFQIDELESAACEAEQNYSSVLKRLRV